MAIEKSLGDASRKIAKAIKAAQVKALNKALTETKQKVLSDLRNDTALTNKALDKRVLVLRPKKGVGLGSINIAVKFGVKLSEFRPLEKMVKGATRAYRGVTIKIGEAGRNLVPGGFLATVKSGKELVLKRIGASRLPTTAPTTDILKRSAISRAPAHKSFLQQAFARWYPIQLGKEPK